MIKAVVLSPSYNYYTLYIRNKGLNPHNYPYYMGNSMEKIRGLKREIPFYFLEGWSENENYTTNDIQYIKQRHPIKQLSEGWINNEGFKFWPDPLYNLGFFSDEIWAAKAYNDAAIEYFGEFAKLNDV